MSSTVYVKTSSFGRVPSAVEKGSPRGLVVSVFSILFNVEIENRVHGDGVVVEKARANYARCTERTTKIAYGRRGPPRFGRVESLSKHRRRNVGNLRFRDVRVTSPRINGSCFKRVYAARKRDGKNNERKVPGIRDLCRVRGGERDACASHTLSISSTIKRSISRSKNVKSRLCRIAVTTAFAKNVIRFSVGRRVGGRLRYRRRLPVVIFQRVNI